jgi:hypothetical protein
MAGAGYDEHDLNLLSAFVEDRLNEAERQRVIEHLASCSACRSTLAAYTRATRSADDESAAAARAWSSRPRVWLPIAATVVLATAAIVGGLRLRDADLSRQAVSTEDAQQAPPPAPSNPQAPPARGAPDAGLRRGQPATAGPAERTPGLSEDPLRRAGRRTIGGKTFQLVAGEWVDEAYDPLDALPEVEVRTDGERTALLDRLPDLRPFASLGSRVIVVHGGTVYKLGPDSLPDLR